MRGKILKLLVIPLLLACTSHKPRELRAHTDWDRLKEKRDRYFWYMASLADQFGWLPPTCDGLLFNSLAAFAGFPSNPLLAEESPGRWRRYPDYAVCKPGADPESASTISRDMFRGLFLYLLSEDRKAEFVRLEAYGREHNWFMGEGASSRTWFNPQIRNQLARIIDKGIPVEPEEAEGMTVGFEDHLDALRIYTEYLIYGKLNEVQFQTLRWYAQNNPRNALFQALYHKFSDGDQNRAIAILLDEALFPANRLPTDQDHFAHYLWQRDANTADWRPCDPSPKAMERRCTGETHSGVDFIFAVSVIER